MDHVAVAKQSSQKFQDCEWEKRVILACMCVKPQMRYMCVTVWVHFGSILGPSWVHFAYCLSGDA